VVREQYRSLLLHTEVFQGVCLSVWLCIASQAGFAASGWTSITLNEKRQESLVAASQQQCSGSDRIPASIHIGSEQSCRQELRNQLIPRLVFSPQKRGFGGRRWYLISVSLPISGSKVVIGRHRTPRLDLISLLRHVLDLWWWCLRPADPDATAPGRHLSLSGLDLRL
jgi:hypothetical protein